MGNQLKKKKKTRRKETSQRKRGQNSNRTPTLIEGWNDVLAGGGELSKRRQRVKKGI